MAGGGKSGVLNEHEDGHQIFLNHHHLFSPLLSLPLPHDDLSRLSHLFLEIKVKATISQTKCSLLQAKVGETLTDWRLNGHWRVTAAAVLGRSGRQRRGETAPNATRPVLTEDIGDYRFAGNYLGSSALS